MKPLQTCVILNGPPNSGKDTIADLLVEECGYTKHQMKDTLYEETAKHFECRLDLFKRVAMDRDAKETPFTMLNGLTPREALIHVSETIIKPKYGKDYFGESQAFECIRQGSYKAVFSDGGFPEEIGPLTEIFNNVLIFHLFKSGTSFEGDSRNYVSGFPNTFALVIVDEKPLVALAEILLKVHKVTRQPREARIEDAHSQVAG